ncbi:MAG: P1 family peptidase [Euryarchaeota archaeon]|nr:P1 family peptidase [Euryarchaeota archaeon]MDE1835450.1 P1 family peptidase [Euryarchaeota archaeon]MDE1879586.1 P1 family peptidase [Euryarchaeota archaeon]MDE2046306.1 P1 family peptidase [Thermoplasmata archaeon]
MPKRPRSLTSVPGLLVGCAEDPGRTTGVTAVLFPRTARGAVEVRGGAPGTFHTDALGPSGCFGVLGALFLSGGSLYGLDAARGIRRRVLERGGGVRVFGSYDRLVGISGAILFDLPRARKLRADYEQLGYRAARAASRDPVPTGSRGAGTGATVGKFLGRDHAMKGGLGSSSRHLPGGGQVGALVAVNAVGNVVDPCSGKVVAGARKPGGGFAGPDDMFRSLRRHPRSSPPRGTSLAIIATDLPLSRRDLLRVAHAAHDGLARSIVPSHSSTDGDSVFVVSTTPESRSSFWPAPGGEPYPGAVADLVGAHASEVVVEAVLEGVRSARGTRELPSAREWDRPAT